jgi:hypothetical protein
VLYSPSFAMTLAMLTLITTPVVMCISSNVALSMGMVGALSIVRFRTAVKDPMDTAYMFWKIKFDSSSVSSLSHFQRAYQHQQTSSEN